MPSPFPGMDPYLESHLFWNGFHYNLCTRIQNRLNQSLPTGFYAEIDEHVWLQAEEPDDRRLLGRPDTAVTHTNGTGMYSEGLAGGGVAVATAIPTLDVTLPKTRETKQKYVKIVGPNHSTVVTVIELLSPSNKENAEHRAKYLNKRDECFSTGTNFVEIDLLRSSGRMPMGEPQPPNADYYVFICRGNNYPRASVWAFTVRDSIPAIPVPLMNTYPDVPLALQPCVTEIYDTNRYATRIDYTQPPVPPLRSHDAEWAATLLEKPSRKKQ